MTDMKKIEDHRAMLYSKPKGEYTYHDLYFDPDTGLVFAAIKGSHGLAYISLNKSKGTSSKSYLVTKIERTKGTSVEISANKLGQYTYKQQTEAVS